MIKPIWFHPGAHETVLQSDQPLVAIKTYTNPDGTINLAVFGRDGSLWTRQSIPLMDRNAEGFGSPSHSWAEFAPDNADEEARPSPQPWQGPPRELGRHPAQYAGPGEFPSRGVGESDEAFEDRKRKWQSDADAKMQTARSAPAPFQGRPSGGDADKPKADAPAVVKDPQGREMKTGA